jgi:NAD(P)-dependent dehydrogenase (short-subunit alcohol dehydrogenase family)
MSESIETVIVTGATPTGWRGSPPTSAPDRLAAVAGDVGVATGETLVRTAVARFGRVDVLVNNAGSFAGKPFVDVTEAELDGFLTGNLKGTFLTAQAAVRRMRQQGTGGTIINVGTVLVDHAISGVLASAPLVSKGRRPRADRQPGRRTGG